MTWIQRNFRFLLYLFLLSWIILAIIFGFCDLQISRMISNPDSIVGIIGRDFGEAPGYGLISVSIAILLGMNLKDAKRQKLGSIVPIIIGTIYLIIAINSNNFKGIIDSLAIILTTILFIFITWKKDWKDYKTFAWITFLITILNSILFVQTFKTIWGRVRFRNLTANYQDYTPWFIPRGITGNKSFPSGHASMSFLTLTLLLPINNIKIKKAYRLIISFIIIVWAFFVAISRVLIGAHYASDVLFSAQVSLILFLLLTYYLYKN